MRLGIAEYAYPVKFMREGLSVSKSGYHQGEAARNPLRPSAART